MKAKIKTGAIVAIASFVMPIMSARADIYVDAAADPGSADGSSAFPYATIQAAVSAAPSGETIHIAAGEYATGGDDRVGMTSARVHIYRKSLHLIGAGRGKTVILGVAGDDSDGRGTGAWRCILVDGGDGTIIEKVTLKNGSTVKPDYSRYSRSSGGGMLVQNGSDTLSVYLVDSEIVNCRAVYGGGTKGGTLVRCIVDGCYADAGVAATGARLINCVVSRSSRAGYISKDGIAELSSLYNCTFVDNKVSYAIANNSSANGCVVLLSSTTAENVDSTVNECVFGSSASRGIMQLLAPAAGDFRLIAGSDAVGAASISSLEGLTLPAGVDALADFAGKPIVAQGGKIDAGAFQGAVTPAAGGLFFQPDVHSVPLIVDGRTNLLDKFNWVFPDVYPTQYVFAAKADGLALCRLARRNPASNNYNEQLGFAPGLDDTFTLLPPPDPNLVFTNFFDFADTGKVKWADADNGDDGNDGSEGLPYKTIKAAVESLDLTTGRSVIYVKKGRYDSGTMSNGHGTFRFAVDAGNYGRVRIVAVDGPENTFIVGASDPTESELETYSGCGPDAVRGVFLMGRQEVSLQGFTITGCYTPTGTDSRKRGAAFYSDRGWNRAQITDCIISNNYSYMSIIHGGLMKRCRVEGNFSNDTIFGGAGSETDISVNGLNGTAAFCVFANNTLTTPGEDTQGVFGGAACVYNCTVVGEPNVGRLVSGKAAYSLNTIYYGGGTVPGSASLTNCVLWAVGDSSGNTEAVKKLANPDFKSLGTGDFHVSTRSPCLGYAAEVGSDPYFWRVFDGAMDGALSFRNGRAVVGACQTAIWKAIDGFMIKIR